MEQLPKLRSLSYPASQSLTLGTAVIGLVWILLETLNWLICSGSNIIQYLSGTATVIFRVLS